LTSPLDAKVINGKLDSGKVKPDKRAKPLPLREPDKNPLPHEEPKEAPAEIEKVKASKPKTTKKTDKKTTTPKEINFPQPAFINDYGFLKIKNGILEKIGWPLKTHIDLLIDFKDGALVVKKKP
jgi:hypothetical protein